MKPCRPILQRLLTENGHSVVDWDGRDLLCCSVADWDGKDLLCCSVADWDGRDLSKTRYNYAHNDLRSATNQFLGPDLKDFIQGRGERGYNER